jgi:hypothetical protein
MTILFAVILIAEVFFLRETLYPRSRMLRLFPYADGIIAGAADIEKMARRPSVATEVALKRAEMLAFINVKPAPGMRHPKPWDSILRFIQTFKFFTVFFAVWTFLLRRVLVDLLDHHLHTLCLRSVFAVNTRSAIHRPYPRDVVSRVVFRGSSSPSSSLRKTREQGYPR